MSGRTRRVVLVLSSATPTMHDGHKSGYYWSETYYPYEEFVKAGYTVDFVSLTGQASPDEQSVSLATELMQLEFSGAKAWHDKSHKIHKDLAQLKSAAQVKPQDYDIIFFAGGHACVWDLPNATAIHQLAAKIYESGGVVAAVCHGPAVFGGLKLSNGQYLIQGKRSAGFTEEEEEKVGALKWLREQNIPMTGELIAKAGGTHEKGGVMKDFSIADGRVVSGQNPTSAASTAKKAIEISQGKTTAESKH